MENRKEKRSIDKMVLKTAWKKNAYHAQMIRAQEESDFTTTRARRQWTNAFKLSRVALFFQ